MHFSKQTENDSGGLWKWIEGLLRREDPDEKDKKSSSDSDNEDGEGGLMIPIPKGVDGLASASVSINKP